MRTSDCLYLLALPPVHGPVVLCALVAMCPLVLRQACMPGRLLANDRQLLVPTGHTDGEG